MDKSDSWFWKCILNLRDWVGKHIRYKIEDGKTINVWHDKWNSELSLSSHISKRDIFCAGFHDNTSLADVINENGWKWPEHWLVKYPFLQNLAVPVFNERPDKAVWVDKKGNVKNYSTSTVWKDVRDGDNCVQWKNLVWYSHYIPKHAFILWLAVKQKLCTQDKLLKWYPTRSFECSLCKEEMDSHDHLFFKCKFAQEVWIKMCKMANVKFTDTTWEGIVNKMCIKDSNSKVWEIIKRLCFAATVYHIWQERNGRLFTECSRSADILFNIICDEIRAKLVSIKVKQTDNVLKAEASWNVKFDRKTNGGL